MSTFLYVLTDLCALPLPELGNLRKKLQVAKNKTALLDLLCCIELLHNKRLFSETDLELTVYSSYVLEHYEAFIQNGCKRTQLPIIFITLKIARVGPLAKPGLKEEPCCKTTATEPKPVLKETTVSKEIMLVYPPKQSRAEDFIRNKRKEYLASALQLTGVSNPTVLTTKLLEHFFVSINKDFFDGLLPLPAFSISKKLRNAGAYFQPSTKGNKIAFSAMRFTDAFADGKREAMSSGLRCNNRLAWTEITMEHEMIHYFIHFSQFEKQNPGIDVSVLGTHGHGSLFRDLSVQLFRHKSIYCQTTDTTSLSTIDKSMVRKGMTVTFRSADGTTLTGIVARVNPKTVTIPWGPTLTRYVYYSSLLSRG